VNIRLLRDSEFDQLMALVQKCYGAEAEPPEWWRWRYFNPEGGARHSIVVAEEGAKIVGMQPLTISNFRYDGKLVSGGVLTGVMVDPGFRGRGLFRQLIDHCVKVATEAGAGFVCTMPNERSFPLFMKLRWADPGLRTLLVDLPLVRVPVRDLVGLESLGSFDASHDLLEERVGLGSAGIRAQRGRSWAQGRFFGNPLTQYGVLQVREGGKCTGYVAFGTGLRRNVTIGYIVDVQAPDARVRQTLIRAACRALKRAGARLTIAVVSSEAQVSDHRAAGMWRVPRRLAPKKFYFVVKPCSAEFERSDALRNIGYWELTLADWDGV